ncbi:MAG: thioredoxin family protein [Chthonomonadaceae bacterium]|nr:thioredoxin family protein [Chthonomonadaceae bacterium]
MYYAKKIGIVGALAMLGLTGLVCPSRADEVIIARMTASPDGGMHVPMPVKIKLSETKPANITKEPAYLHTPLYGTITLGDAKDSQITVVLDSASNATVPRLYVDGNGNGDLTDDPVVTLVPLVTTPSKTVVLPTGSARLGARVMVNARYKVGPGVATVPSGLTFVVSGTDLAYNRDYSREGRLTLGDRTYRVALLDQGLDGRYADYKHEEGQPAKVVLLIDRNGNGQFDLPGEAYDLSKPFRLGGSSYEVATVDNKGTTISLKKSAGSARERITAADLRVGGDTIAFDVETTAGKRVSFPDDYKGRIVLLDFWATWCPPCRDEVPEIVRVFNQYHPAGFDILGISLDKSDAKQTLADYTQQMGMTWPEVFDGGYWNAEVAHLYGVQAIPHSLLIDGDTGKVLAMGDSLRGAGLEQAVANALANKKK